MKGPLGQRFASTHSLEYRDIFRDQYSETDIFSVPRCHLYAYLTDR